MWKQKVEVVVEIINEENVNQAIFDYADKKYGKQSNVATAHPIAAELRGIAIEIKGTVSEIY